jgi:hypothetical protein
LWAEIRRAAWKEAHLVRSISSSKLHTIALDLLVDSGYNEGKTFCPVMYFVAPRPLTSRMIPNADAFYHQGATMPLELVVGAAVGAAVASPTIRKTVRKGLVYGLAGALIAYDNMAVLANKARNLRKGSAPAEPAAHAAAATPSPDHADPERVAPAANPVSAS